MLHRLLRYTTADVVSLSLSRARTGSNNSNPDIAQRYREERVRGTKRCEVDSNIWFYQTVALQIIIIMCSTRDQHSPDDNDRRQKRTRWRRSMCCYRASVSVCVCMHAKQKTVEMLFVYIMMLASFNHAFHYCQSFVHSFISDSPIESGNISGVYKYLRSNSTRFDSFFFIRFQNYIFFICMGRLHWRATNAWCLNLMCACSFWKINK